MFDFIKKMFEPKEEKKVLRVGDWYLDKRNGEEFRINNISIDSQYVGTWVDVFLASTQKFSIESINLDEGHFELIDFFEEENRLERAFLKFLEKKKKEKERARQKREKAVEKFKQSAGKY